MHEGIRPDGIIVGKALGGGLLPVSALVAIDAVMDLFEPGSHGSTFGGNPLASRVAREALQVIEDEGLIERSRQLGAHLLARLQHVSSPLIRAVRGRGLWVGVELDSAVSARAVAERMADRGVLTKDTHETVIRFAPPLAISRDALDDGVDVFAAVLAEFEPRAAVIEDATAPRIAIDNMRRPAAAHLMMSAPEHFEVSYTINPWMQPALWSASPEQLASDARRGWNELKKTYERLGARVEVQPPAAGWPDMVFTANAAVVLDRKVLLARFLCPERQGEEPHNREFFEALRARGIVDKIVDTPSDMYFEGAGDAIWDATRRLIWTGYGQRSSRDMFRVIEELYGVPAIALELIDPRFYHLDTCFCVLSGGDVLWYPAAFSQNAQSAVREIVGDDKLIEATEEDAHHLGVNSVCIGRDVVMCHASAPTLAALQERGYRVHIVPLDSFNRSGGAAYCLTLRLDNMTEVVSAPAYQKLRQAA
jgi:N-dimethylarginine dimethylaminohydrolase